MKYEMTVAILCSKLESIVSFRLGLGCHSKRIIKGAILYPDDTKRDPDYLYIDTYLSFRANSGLYKGCQVILLDAPASFDAGGYGLILLEDKVNPTSFYYQILTLFHGFNDWISQLYEMDLSRIPIQEVLENASGFMEMELFLSNQDFEEVAATSGFHNKSSVLPGLSEFDQKEVCFELNAQPGFEATFETRGVQSYPSPVEGLHYYYNIFDGQRFLVRLVCLLPQKKVVQGWIQIIRIFSEFIERIYLRSYTSGARIQNQTFYDTLKRLLSGQHIDQKKLTMALQVYQWAPDHQYQVIYLAPGQQHNNPSFRRYFTGQIEAHNPSCRVVVKEDELVVVRNLSLEKSEHNGIAQLQLYLRNNLCKAGMSRISASIERLSTLYLQAKDALFLGSSLDEQYWYYPFEKYTVEYMKSCCLRHYCNTDLQHPALEILRQYDEQNGTELFATLKSYVVNRFSASLAAENMYLHRSTFMHRMGRIAQLIKLDFDDAKLRQNLILSFFLEEP